MKEFDEIYRLYAGDVYRFLLKMCGNEDISMDVLQSTILKAIMKIDDFKGQCSMKTWLCKIARNEYLDRCRSAENKNLPLDEAQAMSSNDSLELRFDDHVQAIRIHRVLHSLDEPYKEIFTLRVFAELKFSEIGNILGMSENHARVSFFRAKEKIIKILKEEEKI